MPEHQISVTNEQAGQRIDRVAVAYFVPMSRSHLMQHGTFLRDGTSLPGKTKVRSGETWVVRCEPVSSLGDDIVPWDCSLQILEESKSWAVIDKPEGVSVHPSTSERSNHTIINALVHHFGSHLSTTTDEIDGQVVPRPGLVHRLDKPTSGTLLIAKTNEAHSFFQSHWEETEKIYYAIVSGNPPAKGKIEAGILRDSTMRTRMTVSTDPTARDSTTFFEVEDTVPGYAFLRVRIPTGRTHQIRVHLSAIGFPVVGDPLYDGEEYPRLLLHAHTLTFPDPDSAGKEKTVLSPVPAVFATFLQQKKEKQS